MKIDKNFVHEVEIYDLLDEFGIKTPKRGSIDPFGNPGAMPFSPGEPIVAKGLANNLWHKSDAGALKFIDFSDEGIRSVHSEIHDNVKEKFDYIETMICEKVPFKKLDGLPTEAFASIQRDEACGTIISLGMGGILTEAWAQELTNGVLMWPLTFTTAREAFEDVKKHWLGKVWLGTLRQGKALTTEEQLQKFIENLWSVARESVRREMALIEMNPIVLNEDGEPVAIDGVGLAIDPRKKKELFPPKIKNKAILEPKKIAIAGVSEKASSFGRKILENLLLSKLDKSDIKVIKPKTKEFAGIECYGDVSSLMKNPVDALVLALPAPITVETLKQLCEQGGGADVVYIVAGGIGDGADDKGYAKEVRTLLSKRRAKGDWTPAILGPNSLGIVISKSETNTLFISPERLPVKFSPKGNIGLVSQSGAFFITRISSEEHLPIKYGHCIGNQMDVKASDFLKVLSSDSDIEVIGAYIEGFDKDEALKFAENARDLIRKDKHVVLYKGGRSEEGMAAAAGHTGSMAGNYDLQKRVLEAAGIIVVESYNEFSSVLKWLSAFPKFKKSRRTAVISNAGFETVGSADHLGKDKIKGKKNLLLNLKDEDKEKLTKVIEENHLKGLVSATNPLDITPMADEKAYLESAKIFLEGDADALVMGLIPLTERLKPFVRDEYIGFVNDLKELADRTEKPLAVVIDSGKLYEEYCDAFSCAGIPVYRSIEDAFLTIKRMSH